MRYSRQLLVACPTTSHKAHGGEGFGGLGEVGVTWGALSLFPFFWAFLPSLDAFTTGVDSC